MEKKKIFSVKVIAGTGILAAFSCLLYIFVKFPLPIFPSFLDIQISELPALIASYAYGPISGLVVILIRFLIKLPLSTTAMVGELGDLIIGTLLVLPSSLIYKFNRTFKGAIISFIVGALISTLGATIINQYLLIPFYLNFYFGGNIDPLIGMCSMIKGINKDNFMKLYLLFGIVPFNLLRYLIVGLLTFISYKKIHFLLNKI